MALPPWLIAAAVPVAAALLVNSVIYLQGWQRRTKTPGRSLLPPGPVVAVVWLVLLGALGAAWGLVKKGDVPRTALMVLVMYCLLYPFITSGLRQAPVANLTALLIACTTLALIWKHARGRWTTPAWLTLPTVLWTAYVCSVDVATQAWTS